MKIDEIREIVVPVCREFQVKRLDVFGSVARGSSNDTSDLDLLVEFREAVSHPAKQFFGLLHRLDDDLQCKIDLLTFRGLRNPYIRERIQKERTPLYEG